jgi:hypothetical protein
MPVSTQHTSAGVYTSYKDLSAYGKRAISSIYGTVGQARRGPVNTKVRILDGTDFTNTFGKRDPQYGFMGYAADLLAPQSNYGYYVRLVNNAKYALAHLTVDDVNASVQKINLSVNTVDGQIAGVAEPDDIGFLPTDPGIDHVVGTFYAADPGDWNNDVAILVSPACPKGLDPIKNRGKYNTQLFKISVYENYVNEFSAPVEEYTVSLDEYKDEFDKQYQIEEVLSDSKYIRFKLNEYRYSNLSFVTSAFVFLKGGSDGDAVGTDATAQAFLDHFADPEELAVNLLIDTHVSNHVVHRAMSSAASNHVNCHCIAVVPQEYSGSVNKIAQYRRNVLNLRVDNMSLYTGRIQVFDSHTARRFYIPCGGYVGSVYLYVDRTRGSHFAPAGVRASEQLKILDMDYYFDQEERDALTDVQVNYFRKLPNNLGIVLWEQATLLDTPSAFQMTSIKRLTGLILASSQASARVGLFDPNDSILRDQLDAIVDDIMRDLSGKRAFRAGSGRSNRGYEIVCNEKNNTPATIANGDLVLDIVFDPTRVTKRIGVRFNINPKGSTATSFVA